MEREKKVVIALYGPGRKGKTTTLNLLIKSLGGPEETEDRQLRLTYGGKRIAIATYGDDEWQLNKNIKFFDEKSCDIYITATRTKGDTKKVLKQYAKTDIIWIGKNYSDSLHDLINEAQAKELHAFIDLLIDNWDSEPKK
ncbi:MAG: hypothetical protein HXN09_07405 [Porphyromonadaceae bacterium]|nr:hypothetical protein [Porphyromonadaceae bacterium]